MNKDNRTPWKPNLEYGRYALMIGMYDVPKYTKTELEVFRKKAIIVANKSITKMMESNK